MYEANPRLYGTSNCLRGVESRLNEIKALGTNVLWLMPICEFGVEKSIGSPYCVKDYKKLDPKMGTMEDLKSLVKSAHAMGMAVIIDWVANHTSWDNPWIANKSWYTQDGAGNIVSPQGWNDVADLDYGPNSQAMRAAMIDALKYWIREAGIDGYRCDAADMVPQDFWTTAIAQLRSAFPNQKLLMLAEGAEGWNFTAGFDMNYAWHYYDTLESVFKGQSATKIYETHTSEYRLVPEGKAKLRFTTNHDKTAYNGTPIEIYGGREGSLAALAVSTWMGGSPLLYSSQECAQASALSFMSYSNYNWNADTEYTRAVEQIIAIRKENEILNKGRVQDYSEQNVVMLYRLEYPEEALVVVNVRNREQQITLPSAVVGKTMTDLRTQESKTMPEQLTLGAYEYRVWKK